MNKVGWIFAAAFFLAWMMDRCTGPVCPDLPEQGVLMKTDTVYLPSKDKVRTVYSGKPEPARVDSVHVRDTVILDCSLIIHDYQLARLYEDSAEVKDNYKARWFAMVYQNKLDSFRLDFQNLTPEKVVTNTILVPEKKKVKVFIGGGVSCPNFPDKWGLYGAGMIVDKKERGYVYSYDPFNKVHAVGIFFKIK